jgi:hypothetical protein
MFKILLLMLNLLSGHPIKLILENPSAVLELFYARKEGRKEGRRD